MSMSYVLNLDQVASLGQAESHHHLGCHSETLPENHPYKADGLGYRGRRISAIAFALQSDIHLTSMSTYDFRLEMLEITVYEMETQEDLDWPAGY